MIRRHASASPFQRVYGYCRALRTEDGRILVGGTAPIEPDGSNTPGDAATQTRRCFTIIREALQALGGDLQDVVRTRVFLGHPADAPAVGAVHGELFGDRPPVTTFVVAQLLDPAWKIEIEAEARVTPPPDAAAP